MKSSRMITLIAVAALLASGCAASRPEAAVFLPAPDADVSAEPGESLEEAMARTRAAVPERPDLAQPGTVEGTRVWRDGVLGRGLRILVSTEGRSLWLMRDTVVVMRAPIAVGMEDGFEYRGRKYFFSTPIGQRRVLEKDSEPVWVPPDWHYFEIAVERDLEAVQLQNGRKHELADGSRLEVRGQDVGRVNQFGNFYAFEPGDEIIFDGKVFIPPFGTRQRQVPDILGPHKLVLGDGYLIHGTNQETSIGDAVSHGCIRMYNADVERLFSMVPVGTPVFIY
ncbi:MAG TPA: L,D-transpeptidase family protein [Longimicrobiales bacterium]|nr:L,D-transpeptidase family protein [Longimicrobiales bacterium]